MSNILKTIHYCWFGHNPKPDIILSCIASWKKYMPEYEIREWTEENYDVNQSPFIKEAYEQKKWAFVSDYARFDIIYHYGGIYFDTDVELLKPIPTEILEKNNFTGFETAGKVNPGLVYADIQEGEITKQILDQYNRIHFCFDSKSDSMTVNTIVTSILEPLGLLRNNHFQVIAGLTIYPSSVFCAFDQDVMEIDISENTVSVHHYAGTWTEKTLKNKIRKLLKRMFGVEGYRRLLNIYRKVRGKNIGLCLIFCFLLFL